MVRFHPDPPPQTRLCPMTKQGETFFTRVGCMDGRVQVPTRIFGEQKFHAKYPDTITDPGEVGILAHFLSPEVLDRIKKELVISIEKHHSKGVLVHGHQDCAGNPVDDATQIADIKKNVEIVKGLVQNAVPVIGVFVKREKDEWMAEEVL